MISSARGQAWRSADVCGSVPVFARRLGSAASQGLQADASIVPYGRGARPCRGLRDTCGTRPPAGVNARPTMQGKQAAEPGGGRQAAACPVRSQRLRRDRCFHRPADGPGGGCLFRVISRSRPQCRAGDFARRLGSAASQGLRDTCGARPPAGVNARPTMQGKQAAEPGAAGRRMPRPLATPAQGPMLSSARRRAWRGAASSALSPVPGRNVGRAISPAAWGLRHRRVCRMMRASSPTDAGQGPAGVCGIPVGQSGNAPLRLRLAAHPPPLAGEALGDCRPIKPPL